MFALLTLAHAHPDEAGRMALYDELVDVVRTYHAFTPQTELNLGWGWADDLPAIAQAFRAAGTEEQLDDALTQLGNSLHNPHAHYTADAPSPDRERLPVRLDVAWIDDQPEFYVTSARDGLGIRAGDVVVSINGVDASALIRTQGRSSNQNQRFGIARDIARGSTLRPRDVRTDGNHWVVLDRHGGEPRAIELDWEPIEVGFALPEDASDPEHCHGLPDRDYGGYHLAERGRHWCLYTSEERPGWPVIRYVSFLYSDRRRPEHHAQRDLRALAHEVERLDPLGLVVDVRDNGGGNDPNWFLDAFARQPYPDDYIRGIARTAFAEPGFVKEHFPGYGAPRSPTPDELEAGWYPTEPFMCTPARCDAAERFHPTGFVVGARPLAVLVGPGCVSSCDSFTRILAVHEGVPLIGEPTAAAHTVRRLVWPVVVEGRRIGVLNLAASIELDGPAGTAIEAVPLPLHTPLFRTWANHSIWDAACVAAAIDAVR